MPWRGDLCVLVIASLIVNCEDLISDYEHKLVPFSFALSDSTGGSICHKTEA